MSRKPTRQELRRELERLRTDASAQEPGAERGQEPTDRGEHDGRSDPSRIVPFNAGEKSAAIGDGLTEGQRDLFSALSPDLSDMMSSSEDVARRRHRVRDNSADNDERDG